MSLITTRTWINLALMTLVLALALLVYLRPGRTPNGVTTLTPLAPGSITAITIERTGRQDIALRRRADGWWLITPFEIGANPARVNALLALANTPTRSSYSAANLDLAQYGLSDTLVTVVLDNQRIVLGGTNPISERRYLMIADTIYMVRDDLYDVYNATVGSYVSNRLVPLGSNIVQLNLPEWRLTRAADGRWDAHGARVTQAQAQARIDAWQQAAAQWVGDNRQPSAQGEVTLVLENGESLRLLVSAVDPELVLARPDLALEYHLPTQAAATLLAMPQPVDAEHGS